MALCAVELVGLLIAVELAVLVEQRGLQGAQGVEGLECLALDLPFLMVCF